MSKIVLFDMNRTLSYETNKTNISLFFPKTTVEVIDQLIQQNNDIVIISSEEYSTEEIQNALRNAGLQENLISRVKILGSKEILAFGTKGKCFDYDNAQL